MYIVRKISPNEFLLHNKIFFLDYSPKNYFEKFRLEIFIQKFIFWVFHRFGIYLYIQKFKIINATNILIQFYYYKTYLYRRSYYNNKKKKRKQYSSFYGPFFDQEYSKNFKFLVQNSANKLWFFLKFYNKKLKFLRRKNKIFKFFMFRHKLNNLTMHLKTKKIFKAKEKINFVFFFEYYFKLYLQYSCVIIYKSLYKYFLSNNWLNQEYRIILTKNKYIIKRYRWAFDFFFFLHYMITYANTTFLFPFLVYHLQKKKRQLGIIHFIFNIIRSIFYLKRYFKGFKFMIKGPANRHSRTKKIHYSVGKMTFTQYHNSIIFYDMMHCPIKYGTCSIKLWVAYI